MRDVMALIARAATMRAGVLIRGEEGTGRQVAARAIHTAASVGRRRVRLGRLRGAATATSSTLELFGPAGRAANSAATPTA